jgi:hypothetical protein
MPSSSPATENQASAHLPKSNPHAAPRAPPKSSIPPVPRGASKGLSVFFLHSFDLCPQKRCDSALASARVSAEHDRHASLWELHARYASKALQWQKAGGRT